MEITTEGVGPSLALRFSKKDGIPIQVVAEGTPGASVVGLKRVNELDYYSLGATQLAGNVDLTMPKAIAVVEYLKLREDQECYKEFRVGKTLHKRYSREAIKKIKGALVGESAEEIWAKQTEKKKRQ